MDIKEKIENIKFHLGVKKENYDFTDLVNVENQLKAKIAKELAPDFEKLVNEKATKVTELDGQLKELNEKFKALETERNEFKTKFETADNELKPIRKIQTKEKATKLFKGFVLDGAELDAYELVKDDVKDLKFTDENKAEVLKPVIDKVLKAKPFLKFKEEKEKDDDEGIIKKQELEKEKIQKPMARPFGYRG